VAVIHREVNPKGAPGGFGCPRGGGDGRGGGGGRKKKRIGCRQYRGVYRKKRNARLWQNKRAIEEQLHRGWESQERDIFRERVSKSRKKGILLGQPHQGEATARDYSVCLLGKRLASEDSKKKHTTRERSGGVVTKKSRPRQKRVGDQNLTTYIALQANDCLKKYQHRPETERGSIGTQREKGGEEAKLKRQWSDQPDVYIRAFR